MAKSLFDKLIPRTNLIAVASGAALVMLAVLTFLQYRSLTELESRTKSSLKENLRQTLLNFERQVDARFEGLAVEALLPMSGMQLSAEGSTTELREHFSAVKRSHPEIDRIFVISSCGCKNEEGGFAFAYLPDRQQVEKLDLMNNTEVHRARHSFNMSRSTESFLDMNRTFLFRQDFCADCRDKGGELITYIFFPLSQLKTESGQAGFAGITLNEAYIKSELISRSISEVLNSPDLPLPAAEVAVSVVDNNGREIYSNSGGQQEYSITTSFGRPFSNWQGRIGFKSTDIEQLAQSSFRRSMAISLLVFTLLTLAIVLIVRATNREVVLARAKSAFVSNVSHELKTPLALIRLFAEMLELGQVKDDDRRQTYYRIINDECRRLGTLIDNILDFSQIEAGRKVYRFEHGDINDVVESVVSSYQHQITSAGFNLQVRLADNPPEVFIDRDAISQALLNLLDNAVKYSADRKEIRIEVKSDGREIKIEVTDRGLGIPRPEQRKIFEKFHRVGNDLVHNVKGSGLGLSLVKHIVEAHKGTVSVESEVGRGSRFTICIPAKSAQEQHVQIGDGELNQVVQNTYN